jgi:acetyl esterase/lipase
MTRMFASRFSRKRDSSGTAWRTAWAVLRCAVLCAPMMVEISAATNSAQAADFLHADYGVHRTTNITFGSGRLSTGVNFSLTLDLYQPGFKSTPLPEASPAIILLHGAGSGDKADVNMVYLGSLYASYGYTVASINYRPSPAYPPPSPSYIDPYQHDVLDAFAWLQNNSGTYHVDTTHVALGGRSLGAQISLEYSYFYPGNRFAGLDHGLPPQPPTAVLDFMDGFDPYYDSFSVPSGAPPAFIVHGLADTTVPQSWAQSVVDHLDAAGIYNEFYWQEGVGHTVDFTRVTDGKTLQQHNIEFLARFMAPEPSTWALAIIAACTCAICGWRKRWRRGFWGRHGKARPLVPEPSGT